MYYNLHNGKFRDLSSVSGPGLMLPLSGRGLAMADLWNDGRQEAIVNNLSDRPMLLVNKANDQNRWLGLRLVGKQSNRSATGAKVTLNGTQAGLPRVWWTKCSPVRVQLQQLERSTAALRTGRRPKAERTRCSLAQWRD